MEDWKDANVERPEANKRVYLKLHAEYIGHFEPKEEGSKIGQWVLDPPLENCSMWRELTEEEAQRKPKSEE